MSTVATPNVPLDLVGGYMPPQRVTIFSVYPQRMKAKISRRAPVSDFVIEAGSPQKPSLLVVEDTWESEYGGEARGNINTRILAENTARHIVEEWTTRLWEADGSTRSHPGIGIAKGDKPTPEEIADAVECQKRFYVLLVNAAREMERTEKRKDIQDRHRMAGRELGIRGESWQLDPSRDQQKQCVWCAEHIDIKTRRCPKCQGFQTPEDAAAFAAMNAPAPKHP